MRSNKSFLLTMIYDARYRSITFQVLLLLSIIFGIWWVVDNTVTNLASQNKGVGFGFLTQTSGFQISPTLGTWLFSYEVGKSSYLDVYYIGIVNTFIVAFFGIFAATVLGFTLGIMRLSQNFIFRAFSTVYIEIGRNVPLLVQLFFGILPSCGHCHHGAKNLKLFLMSWGSILLDFTSPVPCLKKVLA